MPSLSATLEEIRAHAKTGRMRQAIAAADEAAANPVVAEHPDVLTQLSYVAWRAMAYGLLDETLRLAAHLPPETQHRLLSVLDLYRLDVDPLTRFQRRRAGFLSTAPQRLNRPPVRRPIDPQGRIVVGHLVNLSLNSHEAFRAAELQHHDRDRFRLIHYFSGGVPPETVVGDDLWVDTPPLSLPQILDHMLAHRVDILIDHCDLFPGQRGAVLLHRAAPIQIARAAVASTACPEIDYLPLAADRSTPATGLTDVVSERLFDAPQMLCWTPPPWLPTPTEGPSAEVDASRPLRLGVFVQPPKLNPLVAAAWTRILHALPGSLLLWKRWEFSSPDAIDCAAARLRAAGAPMERVRFSPGSPQAKHFSVYASADLSLDSFPFAGHTTTVEALAMGTPVIGLIGDRITGRINAAVTRAAGCGDLLATDVDGYVALATALGSDRARLAAYKRGLAAKVRASPLCDGPGWVRQLEEAYREAIARHNLALT